MSSAGDLRERIDLQREQQVRDAVGGFVSTWVTVATVWARVSPMRTSERFMRQQMQADASLTVTIRHSTALVVSPKMRVLWRGRTLEIRGVTNPDERRQFVELACEELSVQGAFSLLSLAPRLLWDPQPPFLFQDTAGTVPVSEAGQTVARIADRSGNGFHGLQATATRRPAYRTSDGLHWLESDGGDFLEVAFPAVPLPVSRISAWRWLAAGVGFGLLGLGSGGTSFFAMGRISLDSLFLNTSSGNSLNVPFDDAVDFIASEFHDSATFGLAVDKAAFTTGAAGTPSVAYNSLEIFGRQGTSNLTTARFYGGADFGRVLTADQFASAQIYLAGKQGRPL